MTMIHFVHQVHSPLDINLKTVRPVVSTRHNPKWSWDFETYQSGHPVFTIRPYHVHGVAIRLCDEPQALVRSDFG